MKVNNQNTLLVERFDTSPSLGRYNQNKIQYSDFLPSLGEAARYAKLFRLSIAKANAVIESVAYAFSQFEQVLLKNNITEKDLEMLKKTLHF